MAENSIVIYQTDDGKTQIDVRLDNETVWLSQAQMAELFMKDRTVIGRHINNIFREGELERDVVCAKFAHTTPHGAIAGKSQRQEIVLYNLDVIISVGYRVKSKRGTAFRIWARNILKDLAEVHCSAMRKMILLRVASGKFIKPLMAWSFIQASRRRQPCSFTL